MRTSLRLAFAVVVVVTALTAGVFLSSGPARLIAAPITPQGYVAIAPVRVLDTRAATQVNWPFGKPGDGTQITVYTGQVGASAVGVNITMTETAGPGFVTAWASGSLPGTSIINTDSANQTIANFAIVPVAVDGTFQLFTVRSSHLLVDVMGYFSGPSVPPPVAGVSAIITGYGPGFSLTNVTGSVTNNSGSTKDIRVDLRCPNGNVEIDYAFNLANGQTLGWSVLCNGVFGSGATVGVIEV